MAFVLLPLTEVKWSWLAYWSHLDTINYNAASRCTQAQTCVDLLLRLSVKTVRVTLGQSVKQFQEQMCLYIHVSRLLSVSVIWFQDQKLVLYFAVQDCRLFSHQMWTCDLHLNNWLESAGCSVDPRLLKTVCVCVCVRVEREFFFFSVDLNKENAYSTLQS